MFNKYPKYKSQVLAKTCPRRSATRWNKGRWEELTEQANSPDFSFFFFLHYFFFIFFSEQGSQKMQPQKLATTTEVVCGLQKNNTFSEKRAKPLTIFFLYFPEFFWGFWRNQTDRRWVWVGSKWCRDAPQKISDFSDKRAKSYACFTEGISSYVFRKAQHGGGS